MRNAVLYLFIKRFYVRTITTTTTTPRLKVVFTP